jgi:hypothetical protein
MSKRKTSFLCLLLLCLGVNALNGQEAVVPAGGNASGSGGTVSFTAGQVFYLFHSGASGSVSQGVQQPYEIYTVGVIETGLSISLSVFPNPTANHLTLLVKEFNNEKLQYRLYDLSGKLLLSDRVGGTHTLIPTGSFPSGIYLLNIILENRNVQSFKIIKNN